MELSYIQNCPTCGAPVELEEVDRIIVCPFCDGRNYLVAKGAGRYMLPHDALPDSADSGLLYFPYLRFKGHVYTCQGKELFSKILDTTQLGCAADGLPQTLGLRPQAMKLQALNGSVNARFFHLTSKVKDIFFRAGKLTDAFSGRRGQMYHRAFIGETVSFIYLPAYLEEGQLMDAVLNRVLIPEYTIQNLEESSCSFRQEWMPTFLPMHCPHCGDSMEAEKDSLVLHCKNCTSFWQEEKGRFVRTAWKSVSGDGYHLPFWKLKADFSGVEMKTMADLIRLTNHPVVIRQGHEGKGFFFWIPAFKVRPKVYLKLATQMLFSQHLIPDTGQQAPSSFFPVTLPLDEAIQSLKAVLAKAVLNKKLFLPQLPKIQPQVSTAELVFLPFGRQGGDLVQLHTRVFISRTHLNFGRSM